MSWIVMAENDALRARLKQDKECAKEMSKLIAGTRLNREVREELNDLLKTIITGDLYKKGVRV